MFILPDYGISNDEPIQRKHGLVSFEYIKYKLTYDTTLYHGELKHYEYKSYGVAFQLFCITIEKIFGIKNIYAVFLLRHFFTFTLFWCSAYYFHKTVVFLFKNWLISIIGLLFYILNPRIFAEAFYNPKDIIFLSWISIGFYTMIRFIEIKSIKLAIIHAVICSLAISSRIVGIILPLVTLISILTTTKLNLKILWLKSNFLITLTWLILLLVISVTLWPLLWENTFDNLHFAFNNMKRYPWNGYVLYWGKQILASNLKWHYIPTQILITTPILYSVFFCVGLLSMAYELIFTKCSLLKNNLTKYFFSTLLMFFIPILSIMYFKSTLYNGWRHMYFIYPSFLLIGIHGLKSCTYWISKRNTILKTSLRTALIMLILTNLSHTIKFLIIKHPFQYIYFNLFASNEPLSRFDGDYFGLSYKNALEFISKSYDGEIQVFVSNAGGIINKVCLKKQDSNRIKIVNDLRLADFYITTFYYPSSTLMYQKFINNDFPYNQEIVYNQKIKNSMFIAIYNLRSDNVLHFP